MKATGIVRRIDDLGRIVIPKEIRRTLRIREGDPLEIFTDREGEIMLKKYSPIGELRDVAVSYAESLAQTTGELVCITDRDCVVAASGPKKREYEGKNLSKAMEELIERRATIAANLGEKDFVKVTEDDENEFQTQTIVTIICNGDSIGSVVLYGRDSAKYSAEDVKQLVQTAAQFLGRQME
ncbi:MAG: stage V sporulation protein T [Lachnospiraceae bacterium]|nr:stage V sporulation protein T [Lachnospiraceae bacterium]MDD6503939.1 stage V sporulation protein T [Lachnospiraceae bacterium]